MDQSYTIGWLSAFASRMAFPNGIIEINSKPKTDAKCIQNTIMLHTPNSTPAPPSSPACNLPVIRDNLTIFIVDHFTHWLQLIRPTKGHALLHDMSVAFPRADLAQHKLPLRLDSDRHRNAPPHDRFHCLPCECDGLFRIGRHAGFVQHHDLRPWEIILDIRDNVRVLGSATTHEDLGYLHIAKRVAVVVIYNRLSCDTRHRREN